VSTLDAVKPSQWTHQQRTSRAKIMLPVCFSLAYPRRADLGFWSEGQKKVEEFVLSKWLLDLHFLNITANLSQSWFQHLGENPNQSRSRYV